jgi:type I restriction enzyme S subunit
VSGKALAAGPARKSDPPAASAWPLTSATPISRIFKHEDFGYRTITVERPERDAQGDIVIETKGKNKGKPKPDANLRDTENVPLSEDVETYFKREVLPHASDAWIDRDKTKVGYDIPFNPHATMKPSGIEWLGDVPEHWEIYHVRRAIRRIEQGWSPECMGRPAENLEWEVMKSGCVNHGVCNADENKALPEQLAPAIQYEIKAGDVLVSRASGSPELVGSMAFVHSVRSQLMVSDKTFRIQFATMIEPRYFVAVFNSRMMRKQIEQSISGADGLANNLPQATMKRFSITVPPSREQSEIVAFLDAATTKLDALTDEAERAIELLQERRTALISAAVTGKIDVRKLATTETL